jgi:glycosyltransferase involved in cell wall biosynthesis
VRVVHVTFSAVHGGAGRAAARLHAAQLQRGVDSTLVTADRPPLGAGASAIVTYQPGRRVRAFIERGVVLASTRRRGAVFSPGLQSSTSLVQQLNSLAPSIVHLHWTNLSMLSPRDLKGIEAPLAWTTHDMWPFTGGCHYSGSCSGFTRGCGACPLLGSRRNSDISRRAFSLKQQCYSKVSALGFITPSTWMYQAAQSSLLTQGALVRRIPYGIGSDEWAPLPRDLARTHFELGSDETVVAFAASSLHDPRKGLDLALNALERAAARTGPVTLLAAGDHAETSVENLHRPGVHVRILGRLHHRDELRTLYSAADVTLLPSREENLANVAIESMSCGTPVVAFDIGGNSDSVHDGISGFLVRPFNEEAFAAAVQKVVGAPGMRQTARQRVEEQFDWNTVCAQHEAFYSELNDAAR